jgi:hypothetical protein
MNRLKTLIAILLLCAACTALYGRSVSGAYAFFSDALRNEGVVADVMLGDITYHVADGAVARDGSAVRGYTALRALELAYVHTLSERQPVLGLAGSDPTGIERQLAYLRAHVAQLAQLQASPIEAARVSEDLYPFDFLESLASLERARQAFIADGSDRTLLAYEQKLAQALDAGERGAAAFARGYRSEIEEETFRIPGIAGTITASSTNAFLASIPYMLGGARAEARARYQCARGAVSACPPLSRLALPAPERLAPADTAMQERVSRILRTAAATTTRNYEYLYAPVQLSDSTCLATLPAPYALETSTDTSVNFDLVHYLGDLFFIPVGSVNGTVPEYLSAHAGFDYFQINPFSFYLCPGVLEDLSAIRGTLETASIARAYPDVPNAHRAALLDGEPSEADAVAYLVEARAADAANSAYALRVEDAALMFAQKGGGLDALLGQMNYIYQHDIAIAKSGAPFDFSAHELFLTHGAAQSLFLMYQLGGGSIAVEPTQDDIAALHANYPALSQLPDSDDDIVAQLQRLMQFEAHAAGQ